MHERGLFFLGGWRGDILKQTSKSNKILIFDQHRLLKLKPILFLFPDYLKERKRLAPTPKKLSPTKRSRISATATTASPTLFKQRPTK